MNNSFPLITTTYCYNHKKLSNIISIKNAASRMSLMTIKETNGVSLNAKIACGCNANFISSVRQYKQWIRDHDSRLNAKKRYEILKRNG